MTKKNRPMKTWRVLVPTLEGDTSRSTTTDITAARARIVDGTLQFLDQDGDLFEGFAPGVWLHVQRIAEDDDPDSDFAGAEEIINEFAKEIAVPIVQ